jgi:membrane-bound lytic murein transglycosylase D
MLDLRATRLAPTRSVRAAGAVLIAVAALAGAGCSTLPSNPAPVESAAAGPAPDAASATAPLGTTDAAPVSRPATAAVATATATRPAATESASNPPATAVGAPRTDDLAALIALNPPAAAGTSGSAPSAATATTSIAAPTTDVRPEAAAAPSLPLPAVETPPDGATSPIAAPPAPDAGDLWERIRRGFAIPDLETKLAANRTTWYAAQPDYMDRMAQRASLYLFHIVEEIEKRGMPTELALLPFVESAMQPEAVSSAKAAGLWQFIPSTGKIYALEQNHWQDQRRDIIESTRAALDYLQKLYGDFGDWHLALAAYNWGEGAVGRAIARNKAQRKPTDYTSLRMPRETQYYVPKLQAIENIVRDPARYGITLPAVRNEPYFVAVSKERDIDVETAARLAEMPIDEFRALNPGFNRPVIVGAAQPTLLLPAHRAETFHGNLAAWEATGQPLASWTTYTLQKNETLAQVAARADISEAKLREANRIPPRYRLAPGSTILVPRDDSADDIDPQHLDAAFALVPDAPNLRQVTYKVRRGETLNSVARRWRVQPDEIIAWNQLRSPNLFAGQRLTLTVARPAAKPAPARGTTRPSSTAGRTAATAARPGQKTTTAAAKPIATRAAATQPARAAPPPRATGASAPAQRRTGAAPAGAHASVRP